MELCNATLLLIITTVIVSWIWLKNKRNYWRNLGVETPPYSFLWGHLKTPYFDGGSIADRISLIYNYFKARGLKYGGLYLFLENWFIPVDLDLVKSIVQTDFQHFTDKGDDIHEDEPLTTHLLNLKGKRWKMMRSKLTPTFTSGKMKMMFGTLLECTKGLQKVMDDELESAGVDIKDMCGRFTTDTIGSCAFGIECNSFEDPENEFRQKGKACFQRTGVFSSSLYGLFYKFVPGLMKLLNYRVVPEDINSFFMGVVRNTVEYREKNNVSRKDLMQLLIELKNKGRLVDDDSLTDGALSAKDNRITVDEIAAQAFIFFMAGFETSSTTMSFCLYEMACHKDIQSRVRKEIAEVMKKHNNELTYDAIMEMPYLEKVIFETLRKYPPAVAVRRFCTKKYKIPGTDVILKEGTLVMLPIFAIHHDPQHYPDPEKFDPERFSEENKKTRHELSFLAFGEGPRMCIGMRFGMMQTKVGVITMLRNYEFEVSKKTVEPLTWDPRNFMLSTHGTIWLKHKKIST